MKLIIIGCEYAGKSTLIKHILAWHRRMYNHINVHDHFTFPAPPSITGTDSWTPFDQQKILEMTPGGRKRVNHWGNVYHVGNQPTWGMYHGDVIYEGAYIEDTIYGELYYGYSDHKSTGSEIDLGDADKLAAEIAVKKGAKHVPNLHSNSSSNAYYESMIKNADPETTLILMEARPEVIAQRMKDNPHVPQRIEEEDIPLLLEAFRNAFSQSILVNRMALDTSDSTEEETLEQFKRDYTHFMTEKDMLRVILHSLRTGEKP